MAAEKPVVASMSDVAASGGYYMAMGTAAIVAESLTLTGSIGVVTGIHIKSTRHLFSCYVYVSKIWANCNPEKI